jgi:hypothetical protein
MTFLAFLTLSEFVRTTCPFDAGKVQEASSADRLPLLTSTTHSRQAP